MNKEGKLTNIQLKNIKKDFPDYIHKLQEHSRGLNLSRGFVPQTTFWLVNGISFLGVVRVRHKLNAKLKKEGGHIGYYIRPSKRNNGHGNMF